MHAPSLARRRISTFMNKDGVTTRRSDQLAPVVEMMFRRGIGEVAVVDDDQSLLGTVSRSDLVRAPVYAMDSAEVFLARSQIKDGVTCALDDGFHLDVHAHTLVGDVMSGAPISVKAEATASQAAALMHKHGLNQLPVVGSDGAFLGMVSAMDIARLLH